MWESFFKKKHLSVVLQCNWDLETMVLWLLLPAAHWVTLPKSQHVSVTLATLFCPPLLSCAVIVARTVTYNPFLWSLTQWKLDHSWDLETQCGNTNNKRDLEYRGGAAGQTALSFLDNLLSFLTRNTIEIYLKKCQNIFISIPTTIF